MACPRSEAAQTAYDDETAKNASLATPMHFVSIGNDFTGIISHPPGFGKCYIQSRQKTALLFANEKPISLMDGGNMLKLLETHGYHARIDLQEAKNLMKQ